MLVPPSPNVQFQLVIALPALSLVNALNCTVKGTAPFVGLAVN